MSLKSFYVSRMHGYLLSGLADMALPVLRARLQKANSRRANRVVQERLFGDAANDPLRTRTWWEKPGLGLMFQIEARPGWQWQRNFDRFNAELTGPDGKLVFDGPTPRMQEWVSFSQRVGCDYHIFEAKWHDGICYWDTKYTAWKTPADYCRAFVQESRRAGIPYGFYYSAVFDHNPDFDDIQPLRRSTPSYLAMHGGKRKGLRKSLAFTNFARLLFIVFRRDLAKAGLRKEDPYPWFDDFELNDFEPDPDRYISYIQDQLEELCGKYGARLMWIDWYDGAGGAASNEIMDFMRERYPEVALTFNSSILEDLCWSHYVCFETHSVKQTWAQVKQYRNWKRPWELITPAAANWDAPQPKRNQVENALTAAIIMASGGKVNFGIASEMDGSLHPEVSKQMEALGEWYQPRRGLFIDATACQPEQPDVPRVKLDNKRLRVLASRHQGDHVLHVFDLWADGSEPEDSVTLHLSTDEWGNIVRVVLEPSGEELPLEVEPGGRRLLIPQRSLDRIDTILRLCTT